MYSSNSGKSYKANSYQDAYSTTKPSSSSTQPHDCQNCKNYNFDSVSFSLCDECENSNGFTTEEFLNSEPDKIKLMDIAAKVAASHYPFQKIEETFGRIIPEPIQRRIIYWSFPREEKDIIMYSSLNSDDQKVSFNRGQTIYRDNLVHNVLQVGFHLSGTVLNCKQNYTFPPGDSEKKYRVSITFDRCKITSVTCSCDTKDIFWCPHVVALALYRIRNPSNVRLRVPISETLFQLDKCQLQKLVQFLISEHHTEVLPTAQSLADKMLNRKSILNAIEGAPDPTAGAAIEQENCWHLDEQQITKQVTHILAFENYGQLNKHMNALFAKVKEMLKARDSNASRMLRLITEQFLNDRRLTSSWRVSDKWVKLLWDQLAEIWVYIALNPGASVNERKKISDLLYSWTQNPNCPLDDEIQRNTQFKHKDNDDNSDDELLDNDVEQVDELIDNNNNYNYNDKRRRSSQSGTRSKRKKKRCLPLSIFHRALEASFLKWNDAHLRFIIDEDEEMIDLTNGTSLASNHSKNASSNKLFDSHGFPLWHETISIACARVEALRCHGFETSALKLAVSVVRTMKQRQRESIELLKKQNVNKYLFSHNSDGNQLDSISTLFDTLAEASLTQDSKPLDSYYGMFLNEFNSYATQSSLPLEVTIPMIAEYQESIYANTTTTNQRTQPQRPKPKYLSKLIKGTLDPNETYISFALEAALIGLGQQRLMPNGEYSQEKSLTQEERLITKLSDIEFDHKLLAILREQVLLLLEGGQFSGFGLGIHPESVPMHSFARYLFITLLQFDTDLAYSVGLRAMRLPILEGFHNYFEDLNSIHNLANSNHLNRVNGNSNHYHLHNLYYQNLNNNNQLYPFLLNNNHQHLHYNRSHHRPNNNGNLSVNSSNANNNWQRWVVLNRVEYNQCLLAITMISAARNDIKRLKSVQKAAQEHIHTFTQLFKLAKETFSIAIPADPNPPANTTNLNSNPCATINGLHNPLNQANHQQLPYYNLNNLNSNRAINSYTNSLNFGAINFGFGAAFPSLNSNHPTIGQRQFKNSTVSYLLEVAYDLGLQVVQMTIGHSEISKRKDIVKWIVNCAIEVGYSALHDLMKNWFSLFTPIEAVSAVAGFIMSHGVITKLNLTQQNQESLSIEARRLAVSCTKKDPTNCALHALGLCENDPMFEKCYEIILEAGSKNKMQFQHLIAVAKYIEGKGFFSEYAYKLCQLAIKTILITHNGENSQYVADIHWACNLALRLGRSELNKLIPILIDRIHCAQVLSDILRRFTSNGGFSLPLQNTSNQQHQQNHQTNQLCGYTYPSSFVNNALALPNSNAQFTSSMMKRYSYSHSKTLGLDKDPLKALLDAAITAYVNTTHSRLNVISPRHYSDFVEFLAKARETFLLASDGENKFITLLETIKATYKGKKKLLGHIKQKFPNYF